MWWRRLEQVYSGESGLPRATRGTHLGGYYANWAICSTYRSSTACYGGFDLRANGSRAILGYPSSQFPHKLRPRLVRLGYFVRNSLSEHCTCTCGAFMCAMSSQPLPLRGNNQRDQRFPMRHFTLGSLSRRVLTDPGVGAPGISREKPFLTRLGDQGTRLLFGARPAFPVSSTPA